MKIYIVSVFFMETYKHIMLLLLWYAHYAVNLHIYYNICYRIHYKNIYEAQQNCYIMKISQYVKMTIRISQNQIKIAANKISLWESNFYENMILLSTSYLLIAKIFKRKKKSFRLKFSRTHDLFCLLKNKRKGAW